MKAQGSAPMMVQVQPGVPQGMVAAPPSKSLTHRALVIGAIGDVASHVVGPLWGEDTIATAHGLVAMGAIVEGHVGQGDVRIARGQMLDLRLGLPTAEVGCANSGTSLRLLTALGATGDRPVHLDGDSSLRRRPMGPLLHALASAGVGVIPAGASTAPFLVRGPWRSEAFTIDGSVSSQYVSALLIAAAARGGRTSLQVIGRLASAPYVGLTLDLLGRAGVLTRPRSQGGWEVVSAGPVRTHLGHHRVEADYSSAAFLMVAAAIHGRAITLRGLDPKSLQGDRAIVSVLERVGASVQWKEEGTAASSLTIVGPEGPLLPFSVDLGRSPDLFPILCVLAATTAGSCTLSGAAQLRVKESDRIATTRRLLEAVGVRVQQRLDGLVVDGVGGAAGERVLGAHLRGTGRLERPIDTEGDHRILMAGAILASCSESPLTLRGMGAHRVSYPSFFDDLEHLGIRTAVIPASTGGNP